MTEYEKVQQSKKRLLLNEYQTKLWNRIESEEKKNDTVNNFYMKNGDGLTSPTSPNTTEELRLMMEYIDRANIFHLSNQNAGRGRLLKLRKFFKSKRNQQVEIFINSDEEPIYKEGKVSAVGRDFVMLTNLKDRIWIGYDTIESANIPFGIPNYSNTHQHYLFDNNLRKKLLYHFGETISKRDTLKQLFFEETLQTNLQSWKDTWVTVYLRDQTKKVGKIVNSQEGKILITFFGESVHIHLKEVKFIETIRLLSLINVTIQTIMKKS
ncbi:MULTISPECIES: hypothetical protein [Sutcliffiella]|uniref:Uncharacterized protein n=1 Tax=Sutcliffiella cohnii TaxID=33932 RepID=A0A223KN45_9BACI|nr:MULTISPECIES: hypothetical protein [Sutcliffiella]AST90753.1 hypothetical protein BC6307_05370 [Sutcliffiella cohnii]WBL16539.1 hypothetical protein O1A01_07885 [Sutcliffiella sp. NC1]